MGARTFGGSFAGLNGPQAVFEFILCAVELGEGVAEVLELLVELLLDLRQLLGREGIEVDCETGGKIDLVSPFDLLRRKVR